MFLFNNACGVLLDRMKIREFWKCMFLLNYNTKYMQFYRWNIWLKRTQQLQSLTCVYRKYYHLFFLDILKLKQFFLLYEFLTLNRLRKDAVTLELRVFAARLVSFFYFHTVDVGFFNL